MASNKNIKPNTDENLQSGLSREKTYSGMYNAYAAKDMEYSYLDTLRYILNNGTESPDRTGVGTIKCFGVTMKFPLNAGFFPAVTTKKFAWAAAVSELLWFLEGSGDEKRLREILHGDYNSDKKTIWTSNLNASYWKDKSSYDGDLGRIYGVQWRSWHDTKGNSIDQIENIINLIKNDPFSRRIILSAWNVGELSEMALAPCHMMAQFSVNINGELDCLMFQRSGDFFLGVPFNIASYSLLTIMLAQVTGLKPGVLTHVVGDAHIYTNHIEQVKLQLSREIYTPPQLNIDKSIKNINDFKMNSFSLINYQSHPLITGIVAV